MFWVIMIPIIFGLIHTVNWLLVKGIMWAVYEIFNYSLYGKFWAVYVLLVIVGIILERIGTTCSLGGKK